MRSVPLDESESGTLDAAGSATVRIGPVRAQTWTVTNVAVSSTSTLDTQARVYRGAATPGQLLAGTYSGNQDNAPLSEPLQPGQRLTVAWVGGTPGARVTVSVSGTMQVMG